MIAPPGSANPSAIDRQRSPTAWAVGVQTIMSEADGRGYECLLVEDCTESYFAAFKAATIEMIRARGAIVGWTTEAARLIEALESHNAGLRRPT